MRGISTHKLLLLAEGARTANYTAGFDYNFGMQFYYNSLKPIFTGASATAIDNSNNVEYQDASGNQQITRYLTNHDVNGAEGTPLQLFGGKAGSMAAFVVATYMKGVPFIYNGQEVAFPTQIPFPFTSVTIDWTINPDVLAEYAVAAGTAVITATTVDQNKTATATLTVIPSTSFTVWFYKPASWNTGIKIYWWDALPSGVLANGNWPGVNMNTTGNGWYSYTFTNVSSTNLIFNDGTNQTVNLTRNKNGWYLNDVWYDTNPGTPVTGTTYYQIVNRWQATSYLYDGGNGQVKYSTNPSGNTYQWQKVDAGSGYIYLKNRATGNYIHVENQNGAVQSSAISLSAYSAMWTVASATDGWSYLQNRWKPAEWINLEGLSGYAQYSGAETSWYSAMWQFVNPVTVPAAAVALAAPPASDPAISLYPNPSNGEQFAVNGLLKNELVTISIFDSNGKLMYKRHSAGLVKIEHHLPAGWYIVHIQSGKTNVSRKLIVQ